jgi:hypothetical protein
VFCPEPSNETTTVVLVGPSRVTTASVPSPSTRFVRTSDRDSRGMSTSARVRTDEAGAKPGAEAEMPTVRGPATTPSGRGTRGNETAVLPEGRTTSDGPVTTLVGS